MIGQNSRTARLQLLALLVLVAGAVATAGCGTRHSGANLAPHHPLAKARYERKVKAIEDQVFAKVNPATIMASAQAKDAARSLKLVQEATETEARELSRVTPPAGIATAHAALVAALRRYAGELSSVINDLHRGALASDDLHVKLGSLPSVTAIAAARRSIQKAGYDITGG